MSDLNLMLFVDAPEATRRQLDEIAHRLDQQDWQVSKHAASVDRLCS